MKLITKTFNLQIVILFILLALGQLQRIQLSQTIAFYLHDLLIVSIVFTWLFSLVLKKRKPNIPLFTREILLFASIAFISLAFNNQINLTSNGLLYFVRWCGYASLFFVVFDLIKHKKFAYKVPNLMIQLSLTWAVLGILQFIFLPDTRFLFELGWDDHLNRLLSTILDPGFTGILLFIGLLFSLFYKKPLWIPGLILTAISLTYARSVFLVLGIGLLIWGVKTKQLVRSVSIAFLFLCLIFLLPQTEGEGVKLGRTQSITSRVSSSQSAVDLLKDNPILGTGFYTYREVRGSANQSLYPDHSSAPDNSFLLLLATTGIIGTTVYAFFLIKVLLWSNKHSPLIFVLTLVLALHAFTNNTLFQPFVMIVFWIVLAGELGERKDVHYISESPLERSRRVSSRGVK